MNLGIKSAQFYDDFKIVGKVAKQIRKKVSGRKMLATIVVKIVFHFFPWI